MLSRDKIPAAIKGLNIFKENMTASLVHINAR